MDSPTLRPSSPSTDEVEIRDLYSELLNGWNKHDASKFASVFADDCHLVGFDGSLMNGRQEIESTIRQTFLDHQTAAYVWKIREVRFLAPEVALVRAVAGMVPPGQRAINPAVNAIQTLVVTKHYGRWRVTLFQNTPAQFHGRPELVRKLTDELQELV